MDLIYTDIQRRDVGVLRDYTFDLAFGSDENDFELTLDTNHHCCEVGCLVYIEGTEYGGIIDGLSVVSKDDKLSYLGRTWHGILGAKVIEPMKVSGEANVILGELLYKLGLSDLFVASSENSGLVIDNYSFDRYIDAYSGIKKMLESVSAKIKFTVVDGKVVVSALPIIDYSQDEQFDSDTVELQVEQMTNAVNHLICLGGGEDEDDEPIVVHLYVDEEGNIGTTQRFFGVQEITTIYEYKNAKSEEEMVEDATEKFAKELEKANKVQMDFASEDKTYDIGDIIGAKEVVTGTVVTSKISKKIVTINKGEVTIQYKVGE